MKHKTIFLLIIILIVLVGLFLFYKKTNHHQDWIEIGDQKIRIIIADQPGEWFQGLSGRSYLPEDTGMLFLFPDLQTRTFVMRGMKFPLDIIFIKDDKIVEIAENMPIPTNHDVANYQTTELADKVLEVNAGFVKANNINIGDNFRFGVQTN